MTHAEALSRGPVHGFAGVGCPGELVATGSHPDRRIGPDSAVIESEVTVYRCPDCGHVLSIDASGAVLNCYPGQVVRALAAALDAKPLLPKWEEP